MLLVLGQDPEAGSRQFADYPGVLYLEEVEPLLHAVTTITGVSGWTFAWWGGRARRYRRGRRAAQPR